MLRASIAAVTMAGAMAVAPPSVAAAEPGACVEYSPLGYCLDWDVPNPGGPGGGGGRPPSDTVTCYWVTIPDISGDESIWVDFGLARPPEGVTVVWQERQCSDGSARFEFRWVIPTTPANLAALTRGRLARELPQPTVWSSPPVGTASIVGVPVFVEVTNWTGPISEVECAGGLCVAVSAIPALSFAPGEEGSAPVACAGSGTRYLPAGPPADQQAAAVGACAYTYRLRTGVGSRPAAWAGAVSVRWTISWSSSSGASGALPAVTRSSSLLRAVQEVQTVVIGGSAP